MSKTAIEEVPYSRTQPAGKPLPEKAQPVKRTRKRVPAEADNVGPKMPARPSHAEWAKGLSRARKQEFSNMQSRLRTIFDGLGGQVFKTEECRVLTAIHDAAAEYKRSPETYRRNFCDLARLAKRDSTTPEDFLTGRTSARGTTRGNAPRLTERMAARLSPATKEKLDEAMEKFSEAGGTMDDFLAKAADRYLQHGRI